MKIDFLKKLRFTSFILALFIYCSMHIVDEPKKDNVSIILLDRGFEKKSSTKILPEQKEQPKNLALIKH